MSRTRHATAVVTLGLAVFSVVVLSWIAGLAAYAAAVSTRDLVSANDIAAVAFWLGFIYIICVPAVYLPVLLFVTKHVPPSPSGLIVRALASACAGLIPSAFIAPAPGFLLLLWVLFGTAGATLAVGHWVIYRWLDGATGGTL